MMWDFPWLSAPAGQRGFRNNVSQTCLICVLVVFLGIILQDLKLGSLDSAGRQYLQSTYAGKVGFLAAFGLSKAFANLSVGFLVKRIGKKWTGVAGWVAGLAMPLLVWAAPNSQQGWVNILAASGVLGVVLGLSWSVTIMMMIDLFHPARAGTASGMNETIGYTASAIFAPIYGALEFGGVACAWQLPLASAPDSCRQASGDACSSPDTWVQACTGYCQCFGYDGIIASTVLLMLLLGLAMNLLLVRDTGYLRNDGMTGAAGVYRYEQLVEVAEQGAGDGGGGKDAVDSGAGSVTSNGEQDDKEAQSPGGSSPANGHRLGGAARPFELEGAAKGDGRATIASAPLSSSSSLLQPQQPAETSLATFLRCSFRNRSTATVNLAGFMSNVLTSLAWGLLLSWARDSLAIPGPGRNLLTSSYSFLKGLVQFATGMMSDVVGRKAPMAAGMALNAAGLLTAALGAGFNGLFDADVTPGSLRMVEYGYLMLAACLMGTGSGIMYPVFAAAIVDHSSEDAKDMAIATFRFWRDLGYVLGAAAGVVADTISAEAAMIIAAFFVLAVAVAIGVGYQEKLRGSSLDPQPESEQAHHAPSALAAAAGANGPQRQKRGVL